MAEFVRYRNLMSDNIRWEGFDFRDDDLVHYEARVRQLASPELAHWIHHGYRGA